MSTTKSVLYLLFTAATWAALPGSAGAQDAPKAPKPPKRERNVIAREELLEAADKFADLYQAIRILRPHFLMVNNRGLRTTGVGDAPIGSPTGRASGTGGSASMEALPVVYIDSRKSGDPNTLKGLPTKDVAEVRYLNPNEAAMEYGLGNDGGAIVIKLFREKPEKP